MNVERLKSFTSTISCLLCAIMSVYGISKDWYISSIIILGFAFGVVNAIIDFIIELIFDDCKSKDGRNKK